MASLASHMTRVFMLIPSTDLGRVVRRAVSFYLAHEGWRGIQRCLLLSGEDKRLNLTHEQPSCVRDREAK